MSGNIQAARYHSPENQLITYSAVERTPNGTSVVRTATAPFQKLLEIAQRVCRQVRSEIASPLELSGEYQMNARDEMERLYVQFQSPSAIPGQSLPVNETITFASTKVANDLRSLSEQKTLLVWRDYCVGVLQHTTRFPDELQALLERTPPALQAGLRMLMKTLIVPGICAENFKIGLCGELSVSLAMKLFLEERISAQILFTMDTENEDRSHVFIVIGELLNTQKTTKPRANEPPAVEQIPQRMAPGSILIDPLLGEVIPLSDFSQSQSMQYLEKNVRSYTAETKNRIGFVACSDIGPLTQAVKELSKKCTIQPEIQNRLFQALSQRAPEKWAHPHVARQVAVLNIQIDLAEKIAAQVRPFQI